MHSRTVHCEPSLVSFFDKHKGCLQFSGYSVHLQFSRFPRCKVKRGAGRVLWVWKVVRGWFVAFSWFAGSLRKNKFYELFKNGMFANAYTALDKICKLCPFQCFLLMFRIKTHCTVFRTQICQYNDCDKWAKNETSVTIGLSVLSFHIFYSLITLFLIFCRET